MRIRAIIAGTTMLIAAPARAQAPLAEQQVARAIDRMFADPEAALAAARAAEGAASKEPGPSPLAAKARWLEGEALSRLDRDAEAEPLIGRTLEQARTHWPNTRLHADLLMTWGGIEQNRGRAAAALDAFQQAHNLFRTLHEPRKQAIALVMIASLYNRARDNESALRYFQAALDADSGDRNLRMSIFNNRGNALLDMGRPADAARAYQQALLLATASGEPGLQVPILNNLARIALQQGRLAAAQRYNDTAFAASRGHSAEYDGSLHAMQGQIALKRGAVADAVAAIDTAFAHIGDPRSPTWREVHQAAVDIYTRAGRPADALAHLKALKRIDDEVTKVASDTNAALLAARFDATNQQLRIEKLRTNAANQRARFARDRALFQLLLVGGLLFVAVGGAALLGFALFHIHRSRREVRSANRDLAASNAQLGKALEAKREFLATTSHEFRTPLNGILGMSQVLLADTTLGDEARARVAVVQDAGQAMQALVDDVLDMASLDSGEIALEQAPFDLRALLETLGRRWAAEAAQRGLAFELDAADCPAMLVGDARRVGQIVHHLLSNAVKFTPDGSVTLAAHPLADGSAGVAITVADTGIGIAGDQHAPIFRKFYQVDGGTARAFGGIGVGLALAQTFASAMGGTLTVESAPGAGATFRLHLPEAVAPPAMATDAVPPPAGPRLLLVEANPLARGVTIHGLLQAGFAVEAVATLAEVEGRLAEFDLLLIGAEVAPSAAALAAPLAAARTAGTSAVVLFDPDGSVSREAVEAAGAALALARPIPLADLVATLATVMERHAHLAA
ncbi:Signal transduction histidine kinase [Sphingomonas sp. NFR04]|uniref:ATP-binding protein n=1 Tax=Sphingomonas sp. NFR04 TaxID=1566283 RepID=UPI0008F11B8E|nr:ATP-binding protein [Sphingomonas sp. NFR04]SFK15386.1 Signal transduction histidine kinase [Sphingomonas sp. NFR04]